MNTKITLAAAALILAGPNNIQSNPVKKPELIDPYIMCYCLDSTRGNCAKNKVWSCNSTAEAKQNIFFSFSEIIRSGYTPVFHSATLSGNSGETQTIIFKK